MYVRISLANSADELQRHENDHERCWNDVNEGRHSVCRKAGIKSGGRSETRRMRRDQDISSAYRRSQADDHQKRDELRKEARRSGVESCGIGRLSIPLTSIMESHDTAGVRRRRFQLECRMHAVRQKALAGPQGQWIHKQVQLVH